MSVRKLSVGRRVDDVLAVEDVVLAVLRYGACAALDADSQELDPALVLLLGHGFMVPYLSDTALADSPGMELVNTWAGSRPELADAMAGILA